MRKFQTRLAWWILPLLSHATIRAIPAQADREEARR
jgi:hypothetical protein